MRGIYLIALFASLGIFGWSYYKEAPPCVAPLSYRIGQLDSRFGLPTTTATMLVAEAIAIWEEAVGRDLFIYDKDAEFTVDFIYDDRQARSLAAAAEKQLLEEKKITSQSVNSKYQSLVAEYDKLKIAYDAEVSEYNVRLKIFNDSVASYNKQGGAPEDVFKQLEKSEQSLKDEQKLLEAKASTLQELVDQVNKLSEEGSSLITEYNAEVNNYNQAYTGGEQFTQGEYQGTAIHVYHYKDQSELRNVLVHEFGHALGIHHVEGASSMMYYLMDKQPADSALSSEDKIALEQFCQPSDSRMTRFNQIMIAIFTKLNLL